MPTILPSTPLSAAEIVKNVGGKKSLRKEIDEETINPLDRDSSSVGLNTAVPLSSRISTFRGGSQKCESIGKLKTMHRYTSINGKKVEFTTLAPFHY